MAPVKREPIPVIIDGITYDVSEFLERHPGGSDLLMLGVNRDVSILFHSYHRRSDVVQQVLKKLPVITNNSKVSQEVKQYQKLSDSKFYKTLKIRVNDYFEKNHLDSRGGLLPKALLILFLTFFTLYLICNHHLYFLSPFLGILLAINGLAIQHDANHGAFSNSPLVNRIFGIVDDLIGGSSLMWRHQHVIAHHAYPNDVKKDADTFSQYPVLRFNPKLPLRSYHKFQHIYAMILYCFISIAYLIGDITNFLARKYEHISLQPLRPIDKIIFWAGKVIHVFFFLVIPCLTCGLYDGLVYAYIPMNLMGSLFLATLFAVNHNTEETEYNVKVDVNWAEMQIRTSANWGMNSWFWTQVTGGLNYQIEHHLFPGVAHLHYPALSKIVRQTCKDFNIPYHSHPNFLDILKSHLQNLYKLGHFA